MSRNEFVTVDFRDFKRLVRDLDVMAKKAVPYAVRNGLNNVAFEARKAWQAELEREFTLRTPYTKRTIQVTKARGTKVAGMKSETGTTAAFLARREQGGIERGPLPTSVSSGEGRGSNPRQRLVRAPNKVSAITLGGRARGGSRRQRNAAAIRLAIKTGKRFAYLDLPKRKGLVKITGGKKNPKVDMVWDTTSKAHRVRPYPTLNNALNRIHTRIPVMMGNSFVEQLRRNKVFGYG